MTAIPSRPIITAIPSKSDSEPVEAIYPHRVTFHKVGWYHWASCSCGWIESGASAEDVSLRAANHDLRQMS